jgi:hypothetical protein
MKATASATPHGAADDPKDTVAYATLLDMAHEEGLKSIETQLLLMPNEENGRLAIIQATVETAKGRFQGIGDADPGSVEAFLVPHLIRVAETRAKARALRDAVNCGIVSFEELDGVRSDRGSSPGSGAQRTPVRPRRSSTPPRAARNANGSDGPMSEAQRRYLFRLLAGQGYRGDSAEEYIKDRLKISRLSEASRRDASALIDELVQTSAPQGGGGNEADARSLG